MGPLNWPNHSIVTVQVCSILVQLGLRSILMLFEKARVGQDGVLLNSYSKFFHFLADNGGIIAVGAFFGTAAEEYGHYFVGGPDAVSVF